jgi:hypothetical protein
MLDRQAGFEPTTTVKVYVAQPLLYPIELLTCPLYGMLFHHDLGATSTQWHAVEKKGSGHYAGRKALGNFFERREKSLTLGETCSLSISVVTVNCFFIGKIINYRLKPSPL